MSETVSTTTIPTTVTMDNTTGSNNTNNTNNTNNNNNNSITEHTIFYEPNPIVPIPNKIITPAIDTIIHEIEQEDWYTQQLTIIVIGASGDLAKKKTYPALFELYKNNLLPLSTKTIIHGFARHYDPIDSFRNKLKPYLLKQLTDDEKNSCGELLIDQFLSICYYTNGTSYGDWETIRTMLMNGNSDTSTSITASPDNKPILLDNLLVYMAIPPNIFNEACQSIRYVIDDTSNIQINGFYRIIIEKPFGKDTESCTALLESLQQQNWNENSLYRIDHYLGKEIVQSIISFRTNNNIWLHKLWNTQTISGVHILFKEPFGTDGRGGYFDPFGIIRDVIQNHLLQVLTLIAMDLPDTNNTTSKNTADTIRDAKVNVLKNIRPITIDNVLLGQYNGYKDDSTIVNKETTTPTYAAVKLTIDNMPQWENVPFIIEAGKALDEQLCTVRLLFHNNNNNDTTNNSTNNNINSLIFRLQPHPSIYFTTNIKTPGYSSDTIVSTTMGMNYEHCIIPEAYTKLLLDTLRGKQSNFVRNDELIHAWNIFTPLLHETESNSNSTSTTVQPPIQYEQGTDGPMERAEFLQKMGLHTINLPTPYAL